MLNFSLPQIISLAVVLLISFPAHEFAHAWTANYFGDDTPRQYGRLTLNPLAHIDWFGALTLVLAGFGWAKPVPVNEYALERHSRYAPALVALAGPLTNLFLGLLAGILLALGIFQPPLTASKVLPSGYEVLYIFSVFNFVLFFFNLLPVFPLDGEKILIRLLPYEWKLRWESLRRFGIGPLLIFVLVLPMLGLPILNWLVFSPALALVRFFLGS